MSRERPTRSHIQKRAKGNLNQQVSSRFRKFNGNGELKLHQPGRHHLEPWEHRRRRSIESVDRICRRVVDNGHMIDGHGLSVIDWRRRAQCQTAGRWSPALWPSSSCWRPRNNAFMILMASDGFWWHLGPTRSAFGLDKGGWRRGWHRLGWFCSLE